MEPGIDTNIFYAYHLHLDHMTYICTVPTVLLHNVAAYNVNVTRCVCYLT